LVKFLQTELSLIEVMRCCCSPIYSSCMHIVVMCHVSCVYFVVVSACYCR
jgi:hypothetical protein